MSVVDFRSGEFAVGYNATSVAVHSDLVDLCRHCSGVAETVAGESEQLRNTAPFSADKG